MPDRHKEPDAYVRWQQQGEELFGKGVSGTSEAGRGMPRSQSSSQAAIRARNEREAEANKGTRRARRAGR